MDNEILRITSKNDIEEDVTPIKQKNLINTQTFSDLNNKLSENSNVKD